MKKSTELNHLIQPVLFLLAVISLLNFSLTSYLKAEAKLFQSPYDSEPGRSAINQIPEQSVSHEIPSFHCLRETQEVKNQEVKQGEKKEENAAEQEKGTAQEQTAQESKKTNEQEKSGEEKNAEGKEKKKTIKEFLLPWKKTIELSYVVTGGNTVSSSFSLGNTLILTPNQKDTYSVKTYFLRAHSTSITKKAVGLPDNYTVEEEKTRRLTAENYLISGQYEHKVTGRLVTSTAFVWDRNKFSGVEGRALFTAGAGLNLANNERRKVNTTAGISFTIRKYSGQSINSFLGFRYTFNWDQKLFDNAFFGTSFIFDDNLVHISDWRYDWTSNLTAPLSKSIALKTSLKIIRTHRPPDLKVPLLNYDHTETGLSVTIPREKVDTFFTTTIVLSF